MRSFSRVFKRVERAFESFGNFSKVALLLLLVFLAYLDFVTGRLIQLSLFYALVAGFVGWVMGVRAVIVTVTLSVALAFSTDRLVDSALPLSLDLANHAFRMCLWTALGLATSSLRERMDELDAAYSQIHSDMGAARSVQEAFLSRPSPQDPRFDLSVQFRTARQLGGDFFDARQVDDRLQVLIADVSGKGASAALVTGLLSGLFSEISRRFQSPSEVLAELDRQITPSLPDNMFVTAFYLVLDLETGQGSYASAGHDPPFLCTSAGAISELGTTGLPVGLMSGFELESAACNLSRADKIVLFTDGLINARLPDGGRLGDEAVQAELQGCSGLDAAQTTARLFAMIETGNVLDDDVVVLTLRRT